MKKISQENKQQWLFMLILSGLMGCTTLSTDIYLPAMPAMEKALGGNVEFTITGFLIGFAIAQLIWGPISDRIGRKKPLYAGMATFTIGSIGCAMSDSNHRDCYMASVSGYRSLHRTDALTLNGARLVQSHGGCKDVVGFDDHPCTCSYHSSSCRRLLAGYMVMESHILADDGSECNAFRGCIFLA